MKNFEGNSHKIEFSEDISDLMQISNYFLNFNEMLEGKDDLWKTQLNVGFSANNQNPHL